MKTILASTATLALLAGTAFAAEPLIGVEDLQALMGADNVVILDVRSGLESADDAYDKGHIPGAVAANYKTSGWRGDQGAIHYMLPETGKIESLIQSLGVDEGDHVVVYAAGVSPKALDLGASTRVYWTFKALGHDNVSILDGGFAAWTAAGGEVSTAPTAPAPGNFTADLQADYLVNGDMVEDAIDSPIHLIDSRPAAHFLADAQPGYARNPGTIPTAVNIPAPSIVAEDGMGFVDDVTLAARFAAVGVKDGDAVYSFCNTGHHATVVWFAASELLGLDFKLYDGSIYDWTQVRMGPTVIGQNPES